jgi:hypothetical protein
VRVKKHLLTDLLLAAACSTSILVVDLFFIFVGEALMSVLEDVACRGRKLRVQSACVLCPRTTNENVIFCDSITDAHKEKRPTI